MKKIITYLCMALSSILILAQNTINTEDAEITYFDTVKITIDSTCFVTLSTRNIQHLITNKYSMNFNVALSSFQKGLPMIVEKIPQYDIYEIKYEYGKSIVVKEKKPEYSYTITSDQLKRNENFSTCLIVGKGFNMFIEFRDLHDLLKIDLETRIMLALKEIPKKEKNAKTYQMEIQGLSLNYNKKKDKVNGEKMWGTFGNFGFGTGVVKNQLYVDIDYQYVLGLSKKGFKRHQFVLNYTYLPIFKEDYSLESYGFVNAGYKLNVSWNNNEPNWVGLEYGYLVKRSGIFFEKNTQKIGISKQLGEYLTITTQLYFPGSFKNLYPGFRLELDL